MLMRTRTPLLRLCANLVDVQHKTHVGERLVLSSDEQEAFWPVFSIYEVELRTLNDAFVGLVEEYDAMAGHLTHELAWDFYERFRALEAARTKLVRSHAQALLGVISDRAVAQWVTIEDEIASTKRVEVARWEDKAPRGTLVVA